MQMSERKQHFVPPERVELDAMKLRALRRFQTRPQTAGEARVQLHTVIALAAVGLVDVEGAPNRRVGGPPLRRDRQVSITEEGTKVLAASSALVPA